MEEDMFVVIVGEDGIKVEIPAPVQVKEEIFDVGEELPANLKQIIDMHTLNVSIKEEKLEMDLDEYTNDDENAETVNEYVDDEDEDWSEDKNVEDVHRHRMVKASLRVSLVQSLRKQYRNQEKLIEALVEIMKSMKPPPPPQDYYILEGIMLRCLKCKTVSPTIPAAQRHYQEKHGPRYLKCFACGVDFRSKTNLYKHEKRCIAPHISIVLKARARFVGRKGKSRPYLYRPPKTLKPKKVVEFPCRLCPSVYYSKKALQSHQYHHYGQRPFKCPMCPSAYTSSSGLSRHVQTHSDAKYICDHCGKEFKTKSTLIAHMDTHLPEKKFKCEECGKRYAYKFALTVHVNTKHRLLPLPYACQICPKRFPKMSTLKEHMKKVHGLLIMTRRMFFKSLPTLTETEVYQAKVIMNSETKEQELNVTQGDYSLLKSRNRQPKTNKAPEPNSNIPIQKDKYIIIDNDERDALKLMNDIHEFKQENMYLGNEQLEDTIHTDVADNVIKSLDGDKFLILEQEDGDATMKLMNDIREIKQEVMFLEENEHAEENTEHDDNESGKDTYFIIYNNDCVVNENEKETIHADDDTNEEIVELDPVSGHVRVESNLNCNERCKRVPKPKKILSM